MLLELRVKGCIIIHGRRLDGGHRWYTEDIANSVLCAYSIRSCLKYGVLQDSEMSVLENRLIARANDLIAGGNGKKKVRSEKVKTSPKQRIIQLATGTPLTIRQGTRIPP